MRASTTIRIHPAAPPKPAWGAGCNGCGVCCLAEPCPVGMLASQRTRGACAQVEWDGTRYRCALMRGRAARWIGRWISAGRGCDSSAQLEAE
jgi:hypothetical protein